MIDFCPPEEQDDPSTQTTDPTQPRIPRLGKPSRGQRITRRCDAPALTLTAEQRLLLLDTPRRSGLPAGDFAALVGISKYTLYAWKHKFEAEGPACQHPSRRPRPARGRLADRWHDRPRLRRSLLYFGAALRKPLRARVRTTSN